MSLQIGQQLGSYEITSFIGKGGMGEVYRARDTRLKRDVAIKVLPDEFSRDTDRVSRFQREAESLAALNHQNIAGIHDLQQSEANRFLVMEFVEGDTLADILKRRGALPVDEALQIAKQICEALEAAHERGIIHRDLKPANIKITPDGRVKVLDFGLSKAFAQETPSASLSDSPTLSMAATNTGMILGTASYMSPEQARGRQVNKASDIWAFGAVLYELLTGRQAFQGEDVADIIAAVVRAEPDWNQLPLCTPPAIRLLLQRCLRKERRERLGDAGDVRIEIEDAVSGAAPSEPVAAAHRSWKSFAWGAATVFLLSVLGWSALLLLRTSETALPLQATLLPPKDHHFSMGSPFPPDFAISPDGTKIAFAASDVTTKMTMLWVRALGSTVAQLLGGTAGAARPFWSPDSKSIAFFVRPNLKKIDASGGPVITLAPVGPVGPQGGTWGTDGTIVFTRGTIGEGLYQVSSDGGPVTGVTRYDSGEANHSAPFLLPNARHLVFNVWRPEHDVSEVRLLDLKTKDQSVLLQVDSPVQYANGYLFYIEQGNLMAIPFDVSSPTVTGVPITMEQQVSAFSISPSGLLAFQNRAAGTTQLVWHTRDGKEIGQVGSTGQYTSVTLSPDGTRAVASVLDAQTDKRDIGVFELARGTSARVTVGGMGANFPIWSGDGGTVIYWDGEGGGGIYTKPVSGFGGSELLKKEAAEVEPFSVSPDGKFLVYGTFPNGARQRLWIHELAPEKSGTKDFPLLGGNFQESNAQFSPDGRWLAYNSSETGRLEIYVVPFPSLSRKIQISNSGGGFPRWRRDGKEMFYIAPDGNMTAVALDTSANSLTPGTPKAMFVTGMSIGRSDYQYDVTADGQRFLINTPPPGQDSEPITLYVNWMAALQK